MEDIIAYAEVKDNIYSQKHNVYQKLFESFILNPFFPWVFIVLLYNRKNWKKPVIIILILHWVFRSVGDSISAYAAFIPWAPNTYWPYTDKGWVMAQALPNIFWLSGEIIGDWYPLLRTKAVTKGSKNIIYVYVACIIYNLVKVYSIYALFGDLPIDFRLKDDEGNNVRDIARIKIRYWSTILALQITSFIYDLSVILSLRKGLFNKLKQYKGISGNTFLYKFKLISEFRIIFSMIASMIFLPFIIGFVFYLVQVYKMEGTGSIVASDEPVDGIRCAVLNINFTLIYVDQILLKMLNKNNVTNYQTNDGKSSYHNRSNNNLSSSYLSSNLGSKSNLGSNSDFNSNSDFKKNSNTNINVMMNPNNMDNMIDIEKLYNANNKYNYNNNNFNFNNNYNRQMANHTENNYLNKNDSYENLYDTSMNYNNHEELNNNDKSYNKKYSEKNNEASNYYYNNLKNIEKGEISPETLEKTPMIYRNKKN